MQVPIRPVKGERILLRKPGFLPKTPVRNFEAYVVPQLDGDILVGATREELRFDQVVTANGVNRMIDAAVLSYPGLAGAEFVSGRSGVRPATPDGMPVLGPIETLEHTETETRGIVHPLEMAPVKTPCSPIPQT